MTDENRSLKDKIRDFLEEKGVYVVLLASVAIVGIAAAAAYWPKQQPQPPAEPSPAPVSQNEDCVEWGTQVKANTPIKVNDSFELRNTESPVELIMTRAFSFSDEKTEITLELK